MLARNQLAVMFVMQYALMIVVLLCSFTCLSFFWCHHYDEEWVWLGLFVILKVEGRSGPNQWLLSRGLNAGSNMIPLQIFHSQNSEAGYRLLLEDAVEANMNMIRVLGWWLVSAGCVLWFVWWDGTASLARGHVCLCSISHRLWLPAKCKSIIVSPLLHS